MPRWVSALVAGDGPDRPNLRKAGRAAIVVPCLLAFGLYVLHDDSVATYAVFGGFVALVFADYGGPPRRRAVAYATMIVLGDVVIGLGAVLATVHVLGAIGMFVVVFVATYATVFGGYTALHVAPVALAYSLSVLQPLDDLAIGDRLAGWTIGGTAALVAALVMWPTDRRAGVTSAASTLAGQLAGILAVFDRPALAARRFAEARLTAAALEAQLSTPLRPYGPTLRDISMVHLAQHLQDAVEEIGDMLDAGPHGVDSSMMAEVAAALNRTSEALVDPSRPLRREWTTDVLDVARSEAEVHMEREIERSTEAGLNAVDEVLRWAPPMVLSHLALWIEVEAGRVIGDGSDLVTGRLSSAPEADRPPPDQIAARVRRAFRFGRFELDPDSVILKNSVRAGVALGAAVLLAELLPVQHGFWIVLAALCVVRSSASSTYATALEAVIGTSAGFVVAALLALVVGDSTVVMWVLFPLAVAVAAYSPGAIHFAVGQAAFTVLVVLLFGLLDLPGFQTAVIRVETVLIGAVTAVVLSLVMWPRGARAAIARAVADVYDAASAAARIVVSASPGERHDIDQALVGAQRRADGAFAAALAEHSEPVEIGGWIAVCRPPRLARDLLIGLVRPVPTVVDGCGAASDAAGTAATVAAVQLTAAGRAMRTPDAPAVHARGERTTIDSSRPSLERCLSVTGSGRQAIALVAFVMMLDRVCSTVEEVAPTLADLARTAAPHAWFRRPTS
jgi:uncharacterized membrane protein YccC